MLAGYEYTIAFCPTTAHSNANVLSRLPVKFQDEQVPLAPETVLMLEQMDDGPFTARQVKYFTTRDSCLSQVLTYVQNGWPNQVQDDELKPYFHRRTELSSHDGCILWGHCVVIPPQGRTTVLHELHGGHCGITWMKSLARGVVWWPKLDKEIETMVRSCSKCQGQQDDPPTVPLIPWSWPTRPWSRLHIDYLGLFLGHVWLLIIDAHSKWIEVFQMSSTSSSVIIQKLQEVFSRFGLPDRIISDNASNFVSAEFNPLTCISQFSGKMHFRPRFRISQKTGFDYVQSNKPAYLQYYKAYRNTFILLLLTIKFWF